MKNTLKRNNLIARFILLGLLIVLELTLKSQPITQWVKQLGTTAYAQGNSIVLDQLGNIYTIGSLNGSMGDFDPGPSTHTLGVTNSFQNFYISKLDASGNFLWAKQIGGNGNIISYKIRMTSTNDILICGHFKNTIDFDPGVGTYTLSSIGSDDMFLLKLDMSGNFLWAKSFGGPQIDKLTNFVFDNTGNIYCVGAYSDSCDFDPSALTFTLGAPQYALAASIFKLDGNGNFIWAKSLSVGTNTTSGSDALGIELDLSGNIFTCGGFQGTIDFDPGIGTNSITSTQPSAYVSKLDASGNLLWYKTTAGAYANNHVIKIDPMNNLYVAGVMSSTITCDVGATNFTLPGSGYYNPFTMKFDQNGTLLWAKNIIADSPNSSGRFNDICLDQSGQLYLTGNFGNGGNFDFDPGPAVVSYSTSNYDVFVICLDNSGNFNWVKTYGNPQKGDNGVAITINSANDLFLTGNYEGAVDFSSGLGTHTLSTPGNTFNAFVLKLSTPVTTTTKENEIENLISVYPNPFSDKIIFKDLTFGSLITISDIKGIELFRLGYDNLHNNSINLEHLEPGLYFAKIANEKSSVSFKLIKK